MRDLEPWKFSLESDVEVVPEDADQERFLSAFEKACYHLEQSKSLFTQLDDSLEERQAGPELEKLIARISSALKSAGTIRENWPEYFED